MATHGRRAQPKPLLPPILAGAGFQLAELLARQTHDGIAVIDPRGALVSWNSAAVAITGWSDGEAATRGFGSIVRLPGGVHELRPGKWIELRTTSLDVAGETFTVVFFNDATAQRRLSDTRDDLRALGLVDALTELPGRQLAMLHLERAIALAKRDGRSVGLLGIKLDRYQDPGDPSRRQVADEVLRQFAKRLAVYIRGSDLAARLGGDSFLVVLTALTTPNDATIVAVRLMLALAQPFGVEGRERSVQSSIGIAEYPRDAEDHVSLLSEALRAADRAQNEGGGRYWSAANLDGPP
ncbi:MAG TPA: diguanylate cyclase [Candidatus Limnocylindria bacterium]